MTALDLPDLVADTRAGERLFWAGGCASCHASPVNGERAKDSAKLLLGGGLELDTRFGIFRVPNISTHKEDGIGAWTTLEFANAMQRGVSPAGKHYYPAFPYTSYAKMPLKDVIHLKAYHDTLPEVSGRVADHELKFPWNIRRGVGLWKRRYLGSEPILVTNPPDTQIEQGRMLVEGAGHCGECHTPRDRFGGLQTGKWLAGAAAAEGEGRIPNITPGSDSVGNWSLDDLVYYFESGFTPDFDSAGGNMVAVQENLAQLDSHDREAIAAYLKAVPASD
jgi:mono/diheme cytochrome c family protein